MIKEQQKALIAYLSVCFFWGSTYLAIKIGVEVFPPFLFAATRFLIAGGFVLGYSKIRGHKFPSSAKKFYKIAIIGILLLVGGNGLVVIAEQWVPSGIASLIVACVPLFIAIIEIAILRMKRITPIGVFGLVIGFGGVAFLALSDGAGGELHLGGIGLILCAATFWSIGSVYSKTFDPDCSIVSNIGIQMFSGGSVLFVFGLLTGEMQQVVWSMEGVLAIGYLIVFGSIIGYSSYIYALQKWPASRVGTYAYVNPVVAVLLGYFVLHEPITSKVLISMIVILLGVMLVQSSKIEDTVKRDTSLNANDRNL